MRRLALPLLLLLAAGCASTVPPEARPPGRLAIEVDPNPIPARPLGDDVYELAFEITIREVGGNDVTIDEVSAEAVAFGGLRIARASLDREEIRRRGYPTGVRAGKAIRYSIREKRALPDERLLDSVQAEIRIAGTDAAGRPTSTRTTVTIRVAR
jgi:hypothetical protein